MSKDPEPTQAGTTATPLANALSKNKEATAEVKQAAEILAVVHAVLDTKIAQGASDGEVHQAVHETNKVEKRLDESAEKLEQVNATLEREVRRSP